MNYSEFSGSGFRQAATATALRMLVVAATAASVYWGAAWFPEHMPSPDRIFFSYPDWFTGAAELVAPASLVVGVWLLFVFDGMRTPFHWSEAEREEQRRRVRARLAAGLGVAWSLFAFSAAALTTALVGVGAVRSLFVASLASCMIVALSAAAWDSERPKTPKLKDSAAAGS